MKRGHRAEGCQVQCQLQHSQKPIALVTGRKRSEERSGVNSGRDEHVGMFADGSLSMAGYRKDKGLEIYGGRTK